MALYKRKGGGVWWVKFSSGGKVIRRSSGSRDRKFAEEYETTLRSRYLRHEKLGECVHFWSDAVKRYKRESKWRPKTRETNEYALSFFKAIDNLPLGDFDVHVVASARAFVARTQSPSSTNRIMAVFRGVLRACVGWGWIKYAPPVAMPTVEGRRAVALDTEQCARLYAELPAHLKAPMMFAVLTGLREGNVCGLKWSQVDLERGRVVIPSSHYKTKRDYAATLSAAAIEILKAQPQTSEYVFLYDDHPVARFNNHAFRKARKRAGLAHVRWHDLRHTFASWLAQSGASDRVLQQAGGWTSPKMVARYAHLRPDDLRPHVDAVGTILGTALRKNEKDDSEKTL